MPRSLVLELAPTRNPWQGRVDAYRALAYELLKLGDPAVAEAIHKRPGLKPFTTLLLPSGDEAPRLRLTALDAETEDALLAGVAALVRGGTLQLQNMTLFVVSALTDDPTWARADTYDALRESPVREKLGVRFVSPTAFAQSERPDLPLPVPEKVLLSWADRWNAFAPEPLRIERACAAELGGRLALARWAGETQFVRKSTSGQVGFVGAAELHLHRPALWTTADRRLVAALHAFSYYGGTGVGVTEGFGGTLPNTL